MQSEQWEQIREILLIKIRAGAVKNINRENNFGARAVWWWPLALNKETPRRPGAHDMQLTYNKQCAGSGPVFFVIVVVRLAAAAACRIFEPS